jgi:flagellar protein FlaF
MPVKSPINAYEDTTKKTLEGRALEAHVLNRAAQLLIACREQWNQEGHQERLNHAINYNQKLWTFFQIELTDSAHPLSKKIREDLLSLSLFIDKAIFDIKLKPAPELLNSIIHINRCIAAGLQGIPVGS